MATTIKPSNSVSIKIQRVKTAVLAKMEIVSTEKTGETHAYTFKGNNNTKGKKKKEKIASIILEKGGFNTTDKQTTIKQIVSVLTKDSYKKGDCIDVPLVKPKVKFTKLTTANLGDEVYIVIETENIDEGRCIKLNLKQAEEDCLQAKDSAILLQEGNKKKILIEAWVGKFASINKDSIINADDFKNHAITKITLLPKDKKEQEKYQKALEKKENLKTNLFMVIDAEPDGKNWQEVYYDEVFNLTPNAWYYGKGKWFELKYNIVNEYEIHHNNKIYKTIVKNAKKGKYIYIDKQNKKHDLGTYDFKNVKNNYGASYGGKTVNLIDFRKIKNYSKGEVKFSVSINTSRYYMNELTLASLLGAMLSCGYEDFTFNGFSDSLGRSVGGSKTHKNGFNGDLRYLRKDKTGGRLRLDYDKKDDKSDIEGWKELDEDRQNKFNDSLYDYGWKSLVSQKYGEKKDKLLNHCKEDKKHKKHYDHLHIQGYDKNFIKKKK